MVKGVEIKVTLGRDILIEEISALWLMGFDAPIVFKILSILGLKKAMYLLIEMIF